MTDKAVFIAEANFFDRLASACYGRPVFFVSGDDYSKKLPGSIERNIEGLGALGLCSFADQDGIYILCKEAAKK